MTKASRILLILALVAFISVIFGRTLWRSRVDQGGRPSQGGGRIVAATRADPRTFNRLMRGDAVVAAVTSLTHATLVRVNRTSGQLEPRLAASWSASPDKLVWTLKLREGVQFSDGTPFSSADVLFTMKALYDPKVASPMASGFLIDAAPIGVSAPDDRTVILTFPGPYGPGLTIFDSLPILPAHKLRESLDRGTFGGMLGVKIPPAEAVGLGPFVLAEYVPGQRLRFTRNPHFWLRDGQGRPLPYVDEVELQIVPERNAEMLRLQSGDLDIPNDFARPEDLAALKQEEAQGRLRLLDAGIDINPNALWFALGAGSPHAKNRPWLQKEELRKAISYAVDRQKVANTVFLGAAVPIYGPITPGNKDWYVADIPAGHDPARATRLLNSIGLIDRNHDGMLEDAAGKPARFAIVTQKGDTIKERTVAVIKEDLRKIGLDVDVVAVERNAIPGLWANADYDALYFNAQADAFDPARNQDFWLSSGSFHFWNPGQKKPATDWEARIDALMTKQASSLDPAERHQLFTDVQRVFAEHLPALYFAATKAIVPINARISGAMPSVIPPPVLWNVEVLSTGAPARR